MFGFAVALFLALQAQSLSEHLPGMNWDAAKSGPLIVVDADHTMSPGPAAGLASFDRMLVKVGGVSAIVPTQMVQIDDGPGEPPNLYDGLPRDAKVLYLLTLLSSGQLQIANTQGISMSDLEGEQKAVFKSLLPRPFDWEKIRSAGPRQGYEILDKGVVPADQVDQVKMKVEEALSIRLLLANQPNTYAFDDSLGRKPGDIILQRPFRPDDSFGISFRQTLPNRIKPSQLNYNSAGFGREVPLGRQGTIGELVTAIGSAAGTEIHADLRVAGLTVSAAGDRARARDLLRTIALTVTGTYRRVGAAYVLTSDITGMAQRQLRFAAWVEAAQRAAQKRSRTWRNEFGKSGGLAKIGFDPNDAFAPNDQMRRDLERTDAEMGARDKVPATDLTPALQDALNAIANANPRQPFSASQVGLHTQLEYHFILPDGEALRREGSLGERAWFSLVDRPPRSTPDPEPYPPGIAGRQTLLVRTEDPGDAAAAVSLAGAHGFHQLGLITHRVSALDRALAAAASLHVAVNLVIRPWETCGDAASRDLDRNVLGQSGTQLDAARKQESSWQEYADASARRGQGPRPLPDISTPQAPGLDVRWRTFGSLARSPGLTGLLIMDSQPPGYEGSRDWTMSPEFTKSLGGLDEFGYTDGMRSAFLKRYGEDPIDVPWAGLRLWMNLELPFFPDESLEALNDRPVRDVAGVRDMPNRWIEFRGKANRDAVGKLLNEIGPVNIPIGFMPRASREFMAPDQGQFATIWSPGNPLPAYPPEGPGDRIYFYALNETSTATEIRILGYAMQGKTYTVAVDATGEPISRLGALLDRWFLK